MKHPATALRPAARTRINICGLTREEHLDAAVAAGVDAPSPRAVALAPAATLARPLPPFVTPVLLFVNAPATDVLAACAATPGATIHFHRDKSAQDLLAAT